ncbi:MAG: DUF6056 family protein, partial [Anaerolineales bacterium]|nr:DUF6056 family protein [Anaerolineales bacterium]
MQLKTKMFANEFFRYIVWIGVLAMLAAIGMYVYLGTFSRYLSDDYCEAVRVNKSSSPVTAVIERYTAESWPRATMRYSNLLFIGLSELIGKNNMPITIASMVLLWVASLVLCIHEIRKYLYINWFYQFDIFLGTTLGFFSLLQAPNLFQTIYWRSAMMTHFAPLVFGSILFAFLVKQAKRSENKFLSLPVYLFALAAAFIIAGFSEPPTITMLIALPLLMFVIWFWGKPPAKQRQLNLLLWTFAGAVLGLLAMILSPASRSVVNENTMGIVAILSTSFLYSYLFIIDSLKTLPLPAFLSALIPFLLVWLHKQGNPSKLSHEKKRALFLMIIVTPFLVWLLIAAGFSPSVYGQGFPVERMRFLARTMMIAAYMSEGMWFGLLLNDLQFKYDRAFGQWAVLVIFAALAMVYPLRTLFNIYEFDVPEYRSRAELWDLRETYIIRHAGLGERDLVIPGFSGVYQIKELDSDPNHWVNKCAAQYYGVNSIRSVTVPDEN